LYSLLSEQLVTYYGDDVCTRIQVQDMSARDGAKIVYRENLKKQKIGRPQANQMSLNYLNLPNR
jgi:hypothetical protein